MYPFLCEVALGYSMEELAQLLFLPIEDLEHLYFNKYRFRITK